MDANALATLWRDSLSEESGLQDPGATLRPKTLSGGGTLGPDPLAKTLSGASTLETPASTLSGGTTLGPIAGEDSPTPPTAVLRSAVPTYVLLDELGRGGMGVVHRARQSGLEREVAIKRILGGTGSSQLTARFVAEARVTGTLDHPNIVPVHELGRTPEGEVFLAMKLVGGTSWKNLLHPAGERARKLATGWDLDRHLGVLLSVCNAVGFAHARSIVHRDLKPENVMVGEFGEVLVMDWGLAVDVSDQPSKVSHAQHRSQVLAPAGTPSYMSPEMAEGRGGEIGPWTDVYLLGAILHEILSGKPPHRGENLLAVLVSASRSEPPRFGATIPRGLADICRRAMACNPRERHRDAVAFRDALQEYLKNRASERVAEAAAAVLAKCQAVAPRDDGERTRLYGDYAEAVAGYAQALGLWQGNEAARTGERAARLAYANAALAGGDLGLAEAQVARLPLNDGDAARISTAVQKARRIRDQASRSARRLRIGLVATASLIVAGLAVGYLVVSAEQRRTAAALVQVNEAQVRTIAERDQKEAARADAERNLVRAEAETRRSQAEAWRARVKSALDIYRRGLVAIAGHRPDEAAAWFLRAYETAPPGQRPEGFQPTSGEPVDADFAWRAYHLVGIGQAKPPNLEPGPNLLVRDLAIDSRGKLFIACSDRLLVMAMDGVRVERTLPIPCRAIGLADNDQTLVVMQPSGMLSFIAPENCAIQGELALPPGADPTILSTDRCSPIAVLHDRGGNQARVFHTRKRIFLEGPAKGQFIADVSAYDNRIAVTNQDEPASPFPRPEGNLHAKWLGGDKYRIGSPDGKAYTEIERLPGALTISVLRSPGWPGHSPGKETVHQFPFAWANRFQGVGALTADGMLLLQTGDELHWVSLPPTGPLLRTRRVRAAAELRAWACDDRQTMLAWLAPLQGGGLIHRVGIAAAELPLGLEAIADSGAERKLVFIPGCVGQEIDGKPMVMQGWSGVPYRSLLGAIPTVDGRHVVVYSERADGITAEVWSSDGWRLEGSHQVPARTNPALWAAVVGKRVLATGYLFPNEAGRPHAAASVASATTLLHADEVDERTLGNAGSDAIFIAPVRETGAAQHVLVELSATSPPLPLGPAAGDAFATVVQTSGLPWPHRIWADPQGAWLLTLVGGHLTAVATRDGRNIPLALEGATTTYQNAEIAADGGSVLVWQTGSDKPLRLLAIDKAAVTAALAAPTNVICHALREVMALPQGRLQTAVLADDGRSAVLLRADRSLSMLDLPSGVVRWSRHDYGAGNACIQPQGFIVATWSANDDRSVDLIDARTGDVLLTSYLPLLGGHMQRQPPMAFTPDGCRLLVGVHGGLNVVPVFRPGYVADPPRLEPGPRRADGPLAEMYRRIACSVLDQGPEAGQIIYDSVRLDGK